MNFEMERSTEGTVVKGPDGSRFDLPVITDGDLTSYPITILKSSLAIAGDALDALKTIKSDRTLSSLGIAQKSDPVKADLVSRIAAAAGQILSFERTVDNMENKLFALPGLDQTHTVSAIEDREIRDWWRSLPIKERTGLMDQLQDDPSKHERLMVALLRAPAPLAVLDHEAQFMRGVWKDAKRAGDPDTAAQIQLDRELVETSRRGVAHVAGITSRLIDWKAETILRTLIASPIEPVQNGFDIFGFTPDQVAGLRRRIDQEQGKYVSR